MRTTVSPVELTTVASASPSGSPAQESLMRTTFAAVRTFVMAFLILAGSLGAVFASPAQEAGAVSPCTVSGGVYRGVSNGNYYVYGFGKSSCGSGVQAISPPQQTIYVQLFKNGTLIDTHGPFGGTTFTIQGTTHSHWCTPGALYQTVVTHYLNGQSSRHVFSSYAC